MIALTSFGLHTDSSVGIVMKEAARRAIAIIRAHRVNFEVEEKDGYDGREDFLTTADRAAQEVYAKMLHECFPDIGIVGEEDGLSRAGERAGMFFTLDPVDGTRALMRLQSHGIGTMVSLVVDGVVVAAYVGDVMTQEIYGFRPGSDKVHRISGFDMAQQLIVDPGRKLAGRHVLMFQSPTKFDPLTRVFLDGGRLFGGLEVGGGSIGVAMARLWKQEIGAVVLHPQPNTLWDTCPIWGISERLGFRFLALDNNLEPVAFLPQLDCRVAPQEHTIIVVHESRVAELTAAWNA